jgi:hypothetical protein
MRWKLVILLAAGACSTDRPQNVTRDVEYDRITAKAEQCIALLDNPTTANWSLEEREKNIQLLIVAARFSCVDSSLTSELDSLFGLASSHSDSAGLLREWGNELAPSGFTPTMGIMGELETWLAVTGKAIKVYEVGHAYVELRAKPKWATLRHCARSAIIIGVGYKVFSDLLLAASSPKKAPAHPLDQYNLTWSDLIELDPPMFWMLMNELHADDIDAMDHGLDCMLSSLSTTSASLPDQNP